MKTKRKYKFHTNFSGTIPTANLERIDPVVVTVPNQCPDLDTLLNRVASNMPVPLDGMEWTGEKFVPPLLRDLNDHYEYIHRLDSNGLDDPSMQGNPAKTTKSSSGQQPTGEDEGGGESEANDNNEGQAKEVVPTE